MPFGDEPRVQQQVVPLSAWDKAPPATPAPEAPPSAEPAAPADEPADAEKAADQIIEAADSYDNRVAA